MLLFETYLRANSFPNCVKGHCGIDIFAIFHLRDVRKDSRLSMDELVQNMFLQSLVVILNCVCLPHLEGVATMRQHHRHNLMLIIQQVAAMNMSDRNLVAVP